MTNFPPRHDVSTPGYERYLEGIEEDRETEIEGMVKAPYTVGMTLDEMALGARIALAVDPDASELYTWEAWTIEGQFAVIRQELEFAADPKSAHGVSNPEQVALRARFDEQLGYPRKFSREVIGRKRGARNEAMEWEVVEMKSEW